MITGSFVDRFGEGWEKNPSLDIHKITVLGNPSAFVAIEKNRVPYLRITIHTNDEYKCFSGIRHAGEVVAIGYGEHVHFVDIATKEAKSVKVPGYFGNIYTPEDFGSLDPQAFDFLVASAETLLRFQRDGVLVWETERLGIDGVFVSIVDLEKSLVHGQGEWDPPGGWKPFTVRLDDGTKAF